MTSVPLWMTLSMPSLLGQALRVHQDEGHSKCGGGGLNVLRGSLRRSKIT